MRWKTKPTPKLGDTRWVKKFAWFPVKTDSGDSLWLESYYVKECYRFGYCWYFDWNQIGWFVNQTLTPEQYATIQEDVRLSTSAMEQLAQQAQDLRMGYE